MEGQRFLEGKVALVTGASRGIGAAVALALAQSGAAVAVNFCRSAAQAEEVARRCREWGVKAQAFRADVTDPEEVRRLFAAVSAELGPVSILVNNAGMGLRRLLVDTSDEEWEKLLRVNLSGPFYCCREALPFMIRQRWGRIINIASVWGITGASCEAAYAATKGGLIALTKSLAREVGSAGITVNALAPGPIETDLLREELAPEELAALAEAIPSGRLGRPEEVAAACVFLASPAAAFINGQVLGLDGGWAPF
ncbi:short-chain dehydrogenase/reductase SDR [Ammonifex degensii KC4]|uniref:Short-chain dehydrogenase/reductase SDR n=1 Tax=Ammonifex degensii (strain DSM 10501 / KC4) TaxID=429009 RepID=C9RB24_AMMDK|nr:3-oxoacyl-ACP reductase family protein [Ammonifex degensii]ACX51451.1 short-chain dehydrogenase/reductase SDR [Ammonifex degensii KC4]